MKYKRQNLILEIIRKNKISTHEQLIAALKASGINVTQATVSRDIQELGIIKTPSSNGYVYSAPPSQAADSDAAAFNAVISVKNALHTIVVKTRPGMAGGVAAAVDERFDGEMLGSIAGDDTILVIAPDEDGARALSDKIAVMYGLKTV